MVQRPEQKAATLRKAALAAVERLRAERGYWRLERPAAAGAQAARAGAGDWQGRWEGATWLYGKRANVTLQLTMGEGKCGGTWRISAAEPATETTIPVEKCQFSEGRLRFSVTPLFLTEEAHEAWIDGPQMQGKVQLHSPSPYQRRTGTWTMNRVTR